jgi:hypothetical protein
MLVPFDQLPPHARVWVFQSAKHLNEEQAGQLDQILTSFCEAWQSHGKSLVAGFKLVHKTVLVVGVNEDNKEASGCSIDKLFQLLQQWQSGQGLDFFDRKMVAVVEGETIAIVESKELKRQLKEEKISGKELIINTLVKTKEQFDQSFIQPLAASWLGFGLMQKTM